MLTQLNDGLLTIGITSEDVIAVAKARSICGIDNDAAQKILEGIMITVNRLSGGADFRVNLAILEAIEEYADNNRNK